MGVVEIDVRLLTEGPAAIAAAVGDQTGDPLLLRVQGDWNDAPPPAAVQHALAGVPALTLAVAAPDTLDESFDLVTPDPAQAGQWAAAFAGAPHAAVTVALMLRRTPGLVGSTDVRTGLAAESAAYSMLLASPEFTRWRTSHPTRPADAGDARAPRVSVDRIGRVTRVTLTRGDRHNAIDPRMRDELYAALAEAAASTSPVVLRGDGPSFCSGGDLDTFGSLPDPASAHLVRLAHSVAWQAHVLAPRLVVGLHGACVGAGIEVPAFAAYVIAADDARIGLPELGLGLIPGAGGTVSITRRCGPRRVLELLLGAGTIPASTAHAWGLVDDVVPRDELDARLLEIAESLP